VSGHRHAPAALPPDTHSIGGWVGPRAGLDDVEKVKFFNLPDSNSEPSVIQSVASRYTDYAIWAPPVKT
jgi:hypothetical protein